MNDFVTVNGVYAEFFGEHKPARSAVEVARLPKDVLFEIECIARYATTFIVSGIVIHLHSEQSQELSKLVARRPSGFCYNLVQSMQRRSRQRTLQRSLLEPR